MNLSFQEKSLWILLVSLAGGFAWYFASVLPAASPQVQPHQIARFMGGLVVLVIVQIVGHVVAALADRRTQPDERDTLIALKAKRNGGYALACAVFATLCVALVADGNFVVLHVLLGGWVIAQLIEIGSALYLYRRGA